MIDPSLIHVMLGLMSTGLVTESVVSGRAPLRISDCRCVSENSKMRVDLSGVYPNAFQYIKSDGSISTTSPEECATYWNIPSFCGVQVEMEQVTQVN